MKPVKTKAQIRSEIDQQVEDFLQNGGGVKEVEHGISGVEGNINPFAHKVQFDGTKQPRTPVDDVVKALDERKQNKTAKPVKKRPKKKVIYDDFGDPVRWVWDEE